MIEFLKKGSGIHIKPENKGKFTKYCKGKVTSECIARGKRSSDPAVRKRATFAANVRRWKHLQGGLINKAQFGTSTDSWFPNDAIQVYFPPIPEEVKKKWITDSPIPKTKKGTPKLDEYGELIVNLLDSIKTNNRELYLKYQIPFDSSKKLRLTTGKANGRIISENMLDSLLNSRARINAQYGDNYLTLEEMLGLPHRESMFGLAKRYEVNKGDNGKNEAPVVMNDMISNWQQADPGIIPNSYLNRFYELIRNVLKRGYDITSEEEEFLKDYLSKLKHQLNSQRPITEHPLDNGFKFFKTGNYGGGSNHDDLVRQEGAQMLEDPAIKDYLLKALKRNGGKINKAQQGGNTNNWFLKLGSWLNGDLGKTLINLGANVIGNVGNSVRLANYSKLFDEATDAQVKAMLQQAYREAYKTGLSIAPLILLSKDGINYSNIDYRLFAQQYANMSSADVAKYKMDRLKEKSENLEAILKSAVNYGDILKEGLGIVGEYLDNRSKENSTSNYFSKEIKMPEWNFQLTRTYNTPQDYFKPIDLLGNATAMKVGADLLKYRIK